MSSTAYLVVLLVLVLLVIAFGLAQAWLFRDHERQVAAIWADHHTKTAAIYAKHSPSAVRETPIAPKRNVV
jgi:hypothetical protein